MMILELAFTRMNSQNLEDLDQSADLPQVEEPGLKPSGGLSVSLRASPNGRPLQHDSLNLILIKYCNNAGSSCCSHD